MAITYTLNLYYNSKLPSEENYILDCSKYKNYTYRIKEYFDNASSSSASVANFQLQRVQLDLVLVVALADTYAQQLRTQVYNYNYLILVSSLNEEIPYKISKITWSGTEACKIVCSMDVGTYIYNYDIECFDSAIVERSHIDRFSGTYTTGGTKYLIPIIDYHEEPINTPIKYLTSDESFRDLDQDITYWNIVYYSDPNADTGVRTFIVPNVYTQGVDVRVNNSSYLEIEGDTYYIIRGVDNAGTTITYNGNSFTFGSSAYTYEEIHAYNNGGTILVKVFGWNLTDDGNNWDDYDGHNIASYSSASETKIYYDNDMIYYTNPSLEKEQLNLTSNHFIIPFTPKSEAIAYLNTTTTTVTLSGLRDFNLTNTRLIKIIACPFCPVNLTSSNCLFRNISDDFMNVNVVEWVSNSNFPLDTVASYKVSLEIEAPASFDEEAADDTFETKLLNSNYTENSLEYSSYKLTIPTEMYTYTGTNRDLSYTVKYKQSKLRSDLLFKLIPTNSVKGIFNGLPNATSNFLISDIDNEKPIFNNEYINYIKNGYNYDKENMNRQTVVSTALAGIQVLGGVAGIAAGSVTGGVSAAAGIGLITSGVSSAINIANNRIASEANIQHKLTSYRNSSTGIAGVNALDLRDEYEANDLYIRQYTMSFQTKSSVYNLFKLYGYQLNEYREDISILEKSRRYYNYIKLKDIKLDPNFKAKMIKHEDIINELIRIYQDGVFIYHLTNTLDDFDFDKQYENFEIILS